MNVGAVSLSAAIGSPDGGIRSIEDSGSSTGVESLLSSRAEPSAAPVSGVSTDGSTILKYENSFGSLVGCGIGVSDIATAGSIPLENLPITVLEVWAAERSSPL
jgi:hypothetical protein